MSNFIFSYWFTDIRFFTIHATKWEKFYNEKDLILPKGEYVISATGDFSLSSKGRQKESGLNCSIKISENNKFKKKKKGEIIQISRINRCKYWKHI